MTILGARTAAFVIGSLVAGCVYATHGGGSADNAQQAASPVQAGVAVYPGARHTSGNPNGDSADVTLHLPGMQLHMTARRYDTAEAPARVIVFYRNELSKFVKVTVTAGGPHSKIEGFSWTSAPDQTTVAAPPHVVAVRPLGRGTEFAIMEFEGSHQ